MSRLSCRHPLPRFWGILLLAPLASGQDTPPKIGVVHLESVVIRTQAGAQAFREIETHYEQSRATLERAGAEVAALEARLRSGSRILAPSAAQDLAAQIENKSRTLRRQTEDLESEYRRTQRERYDELVRKCMPQIRQYGIEHGFTLILSVNSPASGILFSSDAIDLTEELARACDRPAEGVTNPTARAVPRMPAIEWQMELVPW